MVRTQTVKRVALGISGGIAAYKAPLIVRQLLAAGFEVQCIMTAAAEKFVTPLTLQTLSGRPVYRDMFESMGDYDVEHIAVAEAADLLLIAPATANTVAKLAHGLADDPLSCTALATRAPILLAPAMNSNMWQHPATVANLELLKSRGVSVIEPDCGELACGVTGPGRMPDPEVIVAEAIRALSPKDLSGKKVLISCGPTAEDIDPVRFITNRSSGKMGAAIVEAAVNRGAEVRVISGPVNLKYAAETIHVRSAAEMLAAIEHNLAACDILIMAAAVADYTPVTCAESKIKKRKLDAIELKETADILNTIKARKRAIHVGFAAETESVEEYGRDKLERKGLDMIVANRVGVSDSGFASDTNTGRIMRADGVETPFNTMPKGELAHLILDQIKDLL